MARLINTEYWLSIGLMSTVWYLTLMYPEESLAEASTTLPCTKWKGKCSHPVPLAFRVFEPVKDTKANNPIIFVHGLGSSKEFWANIPQNVADVRHRRVYAIDARDHGDSPWTREFNFDINAVDLMYFIEYIGAKKVTLVGHSMGGITVMKTALQMPSKIDKLIIEDIGIILPQEILDGTRMLLSSLQEAERNFHSAGSFKEQESKLYQYVYDRAPEEFKPAILKLKDEFHVLLKQTSDGKVRFKANLKVLIEALKNKSTLISKYKGVYAGPTLYICGENSTLPVRQDAKNIRKFFPRAKFVTIKNATHDVHSDQPQAFLDALLKFLNE